MNYILTEYSWLTGCGKKVGSAGRIGELLRFDFDGLNTYSVCRADVTLAEFGGCDIDAVRYWFEENADYTGRAGCRAWKGVCDNCDCALNAAGDCENADCARFVG